MSGRSSEAVGKRREKAGKNNGQGEKSVWRGFVDIRLNDLQKEQVKSIASQSDTDLLAIIANLLAMGLKLTLRDDAANHSSIASVTGMVVDDVNDGLTLTGRGPDFLTALCCVWYKANVVAEGGSWESAGSLGPASGGIE